MKCTSLLTSGLVLGLLSLSTGAFAQSSAPLYASTLQKCASGGRAGDGIAVFKDKIMFLPGVWECAASSGGFVDGAASSTASFRCNMDGNVYSERFTLNRSADGATLVSEDRSSQGLLACPAPRAAAAAATASSPAAAAANVAAGAVARLGKGRGGRGGRIASAIAGAVPALLSGNKGDIVGAVTGAVASAAGSEGRAGAVIGAVAGAVGAAADGRALDAMNAAAGAVTGAAQGRGADMVGAVAGVVTSVAEGRHMDAAGSAVSAVAAAAAPRRTEQAAAAAPQVFEQRGSLEHGMPEFDDGSYYDEYAVELEKGTRYTFQLLSDDFDAYLLVEGPSTDIENDDANDSTMNAAIAFVAPESGVYLVTVTSYDGGETGDYLLRLRY